MTQQKKRKKMTQMTLMTQKEIADLKGGNPAAVVDILQTSFTGIGMNSVQTTL
jgi:hypothetical protein